MGAPICQDCNKFCSLDTEEPEIEESDIDVVEDKELNQLEISITAEIRLVRLSSCCGCETKEYRFEVEEVVIVNGHVGDGHEISMDDSDISGIEELGGRYKKSYYGFEWHPEFTCACGGPVEFDGIDSVVISDKVAASEFEDL